jgi:hypothetical protein
LRYGGEPEVLRVPLEGLLPDVPGALLPDEVPAVPSWLPCWIGLGVL